MSRLNQAMGELRAFLGPEAKLTTRIAALEGALAGATSRRAIEIATDFAPPSLLESALTVRSELGRINDLIHAAAIVSVIPRILEPDEVIRGRPSLAAGNDPSRPFDLETDRRVPEFKLSRWDGGSNAMRKRHVFKDLVSLCLDDSGRRPQLFVVGGRPKRFLTISKSSARWALDRFPALQEKFQERFGSLDIEIRSFTSQHASTVEIVDLAGLFPYLLQYGEPDANSEME